MNRSFYCHLGIACLIVLIDFCLYAHSFQSPFIYDDQDAVLNNETIRPLGDLSAVFNPPNDSPVAARPIANFTFAVNYALGGLNPYGYHVFNLLLHMAAGLLLFGVVRRTLAGEAMPDHLRAASTPLAATVALLWTTHPLASEAVVYVTQRTELLMAVCMLACLYACIRSWLPGRRPHVWQTMAVVACALGMASKEVMVVAPFVVLLYDYTFVSGSFKRALRSHRGLYIALAASWLILLLLVSGRTRSGSVGYGFGISVWDYLRTQGGVILHYIRLCFWPSPLSIAYPFKLATDPLLWLPRGLAIGVLLGWSIYGLMRRSWAGFAGGCFFLLLGPTSSILVIATELRAERRMYLPLAAVAILTVFIAHHLLVRLLPTAERFRNTVYASAVVVLVAVSSVMTIWRVDDYSTAESIWLAAAERIDQNETAHYALGLMAFEKGRYREAIGRAGQALEVRPDYIDALVLAGRAFAAVQHYDQAVVYFREAQQGAMFNRAHIEALLKAAEVAAAIARAIEAIQAGRPDQAAELYQQALAIDPESPMAVNGLARMLAAHPDPSVRNATQALRLATKACELTHYEQPAMLDTLAAAYAETGDFDKAVEYQNQVLTLAEAADLAPMLDEIRDRLNAYKAGEPFRLDLEHTPSK